MRARRTCWLCTLRRSAAAASATWRLARFAIVASPARAVCSGDGRIALAQHIFATERGDHALAARLCHMLPGLACRRALWRTSGTFACEREGG